MEGFLLSVFLLERWGFFLGYQRIFTLSKNVRLERLSK